LSQWSGEINVFYDQDMMDQIRLFLTRLEILSSVTDNEILNQLATKNIEIITQLQEFGQTLLMDKIREVCAIEFLHIIDKAIESETENLLEMLNSEERKNKLRDAVEKFQTEK